MNLVSKDPWMIIENSSVVGCIVPWFDPVFKRGIFIFRKNRVHRIPSNIVFPLEQKIFAIKNTQNLIRNITVFMY